jgi:hypothetical protein
MTKIRRSLGIPSALSLLLLMAVVLLWGRSCFVCDMFTTQSQGVQRMWMSDAGRIRFALFTIWPDNGYDHAWTWNDNMAPGGHVPVAGPFGDHQHFGIGWDVRGSLTYLNGGVRHSQSAREWWVPYWFLALVTLPLSKIVLWRIVRWTVIHWRLAVLRRAERARGFPLDAPSQRLESET